MKLRANTRMNERESKRQKILNLLATLAHACTLHRWMKVWVREGVIDPMRQRESKRQTPLNVLALPVNTLVLTSVTRWRLRGAKLHGGTTKRAAAAAQAQHRYMCKHVITAHTPSPTRAAVVRSPHQACIPLASALIKLEAVNAASCHNSSHWWTLLIFRRVVKTVKLDKLKIRIRSFCTLHFFNFLVI